MDTESVVSRRSSRLNFSERTLWDLEWKDLSYSVPVKLERPDKKKFKHREVVPKEVLNQVNGVVRHGEVIAILGPSGAGKSTLLNVLAGRLSSGAPVGTITINGQKRTKSWKKIAAYVEQSDIMYTMLTVRETVTFAAMLKLPSKMTSEEKKHRVESTLKMLGLFHVAESRIGDAENRGISGGEKKRVSIGIPFLSKNVPYHVAIELVSDPGLIFLDEPTSGLDAFTAQTVADKITELAAFEKRTVLLTIHQPRSQILEQFSKIILLSKGKIVFFGTLEESIEHFSRLGYDCPRHENPADYFLDLITVDRRNEKLERESTERVDKLIASWTDTVALERAEGSVERSAGGSQSIDDGDFGYQVTIFTEIGYLLQRYFRVQFRNIQAIVGQIIQTLIVSLLLSFVFFQLSDNFGSIQSRIGLLFFIPINQMFVIIIPLIDSFTKDRDIILRERYSSTYRIFSGYVAKFLSLLPMQLILTTIFCFMIYYITGLRTDGFQYFLIFYGFNLLLALCAITLGLLVAASVPSAAIGQIVGPLIVVVFLIFGGALANTSEITWILRWIQYLSPIFYCYTALIQNELGGRQFGDVPGDEYLDMYSSNTVSEVWCMGAMLILAAAFWFGGLFAIRITTKPKTILI